MPNIKIYGLPFNEGAVLRDRIRELIKDAPYHGDVVITRISSWVENEDDDQMPYLEIAAEKESADKLADIEQRLKPLGQDIEVYFLERFIPKAHLGGPDFAPVPSRALEDWEEENAQ